MGYTCGIMLNWLAILAVAFGVSIAKPQIPRDRGQSYQNPESAEEQPRSAQPLTPTIQVDKAPPIKKKDSGRQPYQWHELYAPANIPNWFLAVLAGWAGLMALKTLRTIERQTTATEDAAKAALLSAQAVINAERAWMIVTVEEFKPKEIVGELCFLIGAINRGKTPSKVLNQCHSILFVDSPDNLSWPAHYEQQTASRMGDFIVASDSFPIGKTVRPRSLRLDAEKEGKLKPTDRWVIIYGQIVYEDVFASGEDLTRSPHETTWCYGFEYGKSGGFTRVGPSGYNRHT